MRGKKSKLPEKTVSALAYDSSTFVGLNLHSDGGQPITRNRPPSGETPYKRERQRVRETERKTEMDMRRRIRNSVAEAINNKKVLHFRMANFLEDRRNGKIPLVGGHAFGMLAGELVELKASGKCILLVDLDGVAVFWYFPRLIGKGTRSNLEKELGELVKVYPPKADEDTGDRRSSSRPKVKEQGLGGPVTRSKIHTQAVPESHSYLPQSSDSGTITGRSPGPGRDEAIPTVQGPPERCEDTGGVPRLQSNQAESAEHGSLKSAQTPFDPLDPSVLPPSAYYTSPGWFQTGMENTRPIGIALHLRLGLRDVCARQLMGFFEAKRLHDRSVSYLTDIIHRPLGDSMRALRAAMAAIKGPTGDVMEYGWTSAFPCFAVGMNRTAAIHRDSKGISGGMDVIGVLGKFTSGGKLKLPDLNLEVEWVPGCLAAFDGYDLRHMVEPWEGGSRVTLISFCRRSTWTGLGLDPQISRPTMLDVEQWLKDAEDAHDKAIELILTGRRKREEENSLGHEGRGKKIHVGDERWTVDRS